MKEFEHDTPIINPESPINDIDNVPVGENIISQIKPEMITEIINYIWGASLKLQNNFTIKADKYYGFSNIMDFWHELDRCYLCLQYPM